MGSTGGLPVQQTPGEKPFRVARYEGGQDQRYACPVVDAARRYRLAYAAKDLASMADRVNQAGFTFWVA